MAVGFAVFVKFCKIYVKIFDKSGSSCKSRGMVGSGAGDVRGSRVCRLGKPPTEAR